MQAKVSEPTPTLRKRPKTPDKPKKASLHTPNLSPTPLLPLHHLFSPTPEGEGLSMWRVTPPKWRHRTDRGWPQGPSPSLPTEQVELPGLFSQRSLARRPGAKFRKPGLLGWHMNMPDRLTSPEFHIPGQRRRSGAITRTCPSRRGRRLQSCSPHQERSTSPICGKPPERSVWNRISPSSGL